VNNRKKQTKKNRKKEVGFGLGIAREARESDFKIPLKGIGEAKEETIEDISVEKSVQTLQLTNLKEWSVGTM